jgi:radical S-adenosyl methionine domain-containing protein 2
MSITTTQADALNSTITTVNELVINWHVIEACNFKCKYCYATWQREERKLDVLHDESSSTQLLNALWAFFRPENTTNPLRKSLQWSHIRLSIAGGESLLYPKRVLAIAKYARQLGMRVSIITNGSLLPQGAELTDLAQQLSCLGLSIDSFCTETNLEIGRVDNKGQLLTLDSIVRQVDIARTANPNLVVKINTVVNSANVHEYLGAALARIRPDRWKVLRMLPVVNSELTISDEDFSGFVARHIGMGDRMSVEDNSDMQDSYIMIDPQGRFFQNGLNAQKGYFYSKPITEENVSRAFKSISFSTERFSKRYKQ